MEKRAPGRQVMENLDLVIASIALIILVICTFMGVIMRYFFNDPFVWLQEVQLWCFTWVVFFGGGAAFRSGSHVAIEVVVDHLPNGLKRIIEIIGYFLVMGILLYFAFYGSKLVLQLLKTGRTTNILHVPFSVVYGAFPLGCVLMAINHSIVFWRQTLKKESLSEGASVNGN
ncbi:MAG: TRAP transporter small permease [Clostridia bacterium]|nr:TRAP transporter small permease [Clostridia bacterium]